MSAIGPARAALTALRRIFDTEGTGVALMAYLGLVPGEDSTGEHHRRWRITLLTLSC
jgi:hypothetical protein